MTNSDEFVWLIVQDDELEMVDFFPKKSLAISARLSADPH
jgi:hypothetical protein